MVKLTKIKKDTNTSSNTKKRDILRLLSAPVRYIKRKAKSVYKTLLKKEPKETEIKNL